MYRWVFVRQLVTEICRPNARQTYSARFSARFGRPDPVGPPARPYRHLDLNHQLARELM